MEQLNFKYMIELGVGEMAQQQNDCPSNMTP